MKKVSTVKIDSSVNGITWSEIRAKLVENGRIDISKIMSGTSGHMVLKNNGVSYINNME